MTDAQYPASPGPADVAVVIPAFNSDAYLDQALASVAGQTVGPSTVVVVDDCSSDDTSERARRWQDRLPLELIRLERNRGPGGARQRAIQATNTELVAILDADDFFLPDHLETMAATYRGGPGLISAQVLAWYPGRALVSPAKPRRVPHASYQLGALLRHNFVNFPFFSRELYESVGGFYDQYCEDWNLWIRMVRAGAKVIMASHPTAVSRMRPGSRSFDSARTARRSIDVLTAELHAATSPAEAGAARAGLRAARGRLSFYHATELASHGRLRQARQAALEGLPGGGPRDAAGLLALLMAPSTAIRLERLIRRHRVPMDGYLPGHTSSAADGDT
jgi:GT2 family glycosyltransferase